MGEVTVRSLVALAGKPVLALDELHRNRAVSEAKVSDILWCVHESASGGVHVHIGWVC